jgi:hypothetical protein
MSETGRHGGKSAGPPLAKYGAGRPEPSIGHRAPANEQDPEGKRRGKRQRGRMALELVAMRGKDVVAVRHLLDGGKAWIGTSTESLVRVSMKDFGGEPAMLGEVDQGTYALHVPPRARARVHGADGIPRLLVGPQRVELREGERAVVVLGQVQIRAQVAAYEVSSGFGLAGGVGVWVIVLSAVYAAALAISAALASAPPPRLDPGSMQRVHGRFLPAGQTP